MKKLLILMLIFTFGAAAVLLSTGSKEPEEAEKITITWYSYGEEEAPGWDNYARETIEMYEKDNPNIDVVYEPQQAAYLWEVFGAAVEAGEGPDIQSGWDGIWSQQWVFRDAVAPISDYLPKKVFDKVILKNNYYHQGKYWCMPVWLVSHVNWVNKNNLKKAGLNPDKLPTTWDELLDVCEKIKRAGYTPITTGNLEGWQAVNWTTNFLDRNYDSLADVMELFANPNADFHDPVHSDSLYLWRELVDKGYFNEDAASLGYYEGWERFQNGEGVFCNALAGWANNFIKAFGEENVGILPYFPNNGKGEYATKFCGGAQPVFISSFSPHKQEAADFIQYLVSTERSARMFELAGVLPANYEFDTSVLNLVQQKLFDAISTGKPIYSGFVPSYPLNEGMKGALSEIFIPDVPVERVIDNIQRTIEQSPVQTPDMHTGYVQWYKSYSEM
jgi:ABC-type glycerol-3-phosphate transport system substrate-binding protein